MNFTSFNPIQGLLEAAQEKGVQNAFPNLKYFTHDATWHSYTLAKESPNIYIYIYIYIYI